MPVCPDMANKRNIMLSFKLVWLNNFEVPHSRWLEAQRTDRILRGGNVAKHRKIELPTRGFSVPRWYRDYVLLTIIN